MHMDPAAMSAPTICTIAAVNHLARVRVLHRSLLRTNPDVRFVALIIDDVEGLGLDEVFDTIDATEVVSPRELARMATMYEVTELATSLKPFLLASVQRRFGGPACYVDPDVVVFGDLGPYLSPPPGNAASLTPHCLDPIPRDGLEPPDIHIQAAGSFNLGYCAVADDDLGHRLLGWWSDRLARDAIIDHANHRFTDQRWMDLAVSHFPIHIVRDPTVNVAYWNLHERPLDLEGVVDGVPSVLVQGNPLTFFHFSGFDPSAPTRFSKHMTRPRASSADPAWLALADHYCRELADATRPDDTPHYGYAATRSGQLLTAEVRRRYRDDVMRHEAAMTGLGWSLEVGRPDLPGEPPSAFADDRGAGFAAWSSHDLTHRRTATVGAALVQRGVPAGARGINVVGYLGAETGVGESARAFHHGLRLSGIATTTVHVDAPGSRHDLPAALPDSDDRPFDHDLLIVNADQTPHVRARWPRERHVDRVAGFWAWETERLPSNQVAAFEHVDLVLTPSEHAANAIRATAAEHGIDVPVFACATPIATDLPVTTLSRRDLDLPDGPLVLFCFDHYSVMERKNPLEAIAAYRRAVPRSGAATFVIKTSNGAVSSDEHARLLAAAGDRDDIIVIDAYFTPVHVRALMHTADVYLSLHRCEGFGLTIAEAMACGTPVISTAYSGSMEFTAPGTAELVPFELVEIPATTPHYAGTGRWAAPDIDAAAQSLARLLADDDERAALGERARAHIATALDPAARGRALAQLLDLDVAGSAPGGWR